MNEIATGHAPAADDEVGRVLCDLAESLEAQLTSMRGQDLNGAERAAARVGPLLGRVGAFSPDAFGPHAAIVARIEKLRRDLRLALAQQRQETGDQLGRLARGKVAVRRYKAL